MKVIGDDLSVIKFKVLSDEPLEKLWKSYCEHSSLKKYEIRLLFNGHRILDDDTPTKLKMENNDIIVVMREY